MICSQRAVQQGVEALSVRLGVFEGVPQAQLDGFKSRALRAVVHQAQRNLYAIEWGTLEATAAAAGTVLVLGEMLPSEGAARSTLRTAARPAASSSVAFHHTNLSLRPMCALEAVLVLVQAQAALVQTPTV